MGRRKIQIKTIAEKRSRTVTFFKRKSGLLKKSKELSILCGARVGLIIISETGRLYEFCSTDMKDLIDTYLYDPTIKHVTKNTINDAELDDIRACMKSDDESNESEINSNVVRRSDSVTEPEIGETPTFGVNKHVPTEPLHSVNGHADTSMNSTKRDSITKTSSTSGSSPGKVLLSQILNNDSKKTQPAIPTLSINQHDHTSSYLNNDRTGAVQPSSLPSPEQMLSGRQSSVTSQSADVNTQYSQQSLTSNRSVLTIDTRLTPQNIQPLSPYYGEYFVMPQRSFIGNPVSAYPTPNPYMGQYNSPANTNGVQMTTAGITYTNYFNGYPPIPQNRNAVKYYPPQLVDAYGNPSDPPSKDYDGYTR
ncbi:uncharacterized protein KNAG_0A03560 [Huiozyma naganishii CBS 8797]|uniref:MADS-box domain-containing protein n=1 Tax=Huiozyma naganishii (strain ATCC MYA-139 / BCRC 22969 / CBS 8797 / KCTC 17520 / NBRC 10181 / NCYC 3082 / Yp74L-3) TaxID=1071383 RepID=J7RTI3_HUIN7|nr:hypothetical protein KNAG_0A03560 [Kazachstania naganishii CBS 8797]CCK68037.1 hypothetical protein KNAG_0A03560 [Kazachstania naganishii CBS 8797]